MKYIFESRFNVIDIFTVAFLISALEAQQWLIGAIILMIGAGLNIGYVAYLASRLK